MNHPFFRCAACGSQSLHRSHARSILEWPGMVTGRYPFRCNECHHRFFINVWGAAKTKAARCPHCFGMKLGEWPQNRRPHLWQKLLLTFGAKGYRCTTCRTTFVTFRKRDTGRISPAETSTSEDRHVEAHEPDAVPQSQ